MTKYVLLFVGFILGSALQGVMTTEYPIQYSKQTNPGLVVRTLGVCDSIPVKFTYGLADTAQFTFLDGNAHSSCIAWGPSVGSSPDTLIF